MPAPRSRRTTFTRAVEEGRLKDPGKIGARAAWAAARHRGCRYYLYEVPGPGAFRFWEDPRKMRLETLHQGKYILKTDNRISAHLFVATLALFLKRSLEHQLEFALPKLSGTEAIAAMRWIGLAELDLNGQTARLVPGGSRDPRRALRALGIAELNPPSSRKAPSAPQNRTMW